MAVGAAGAAAAAVSMAAQRPAEAEAAVHRLSFRPRRTFTASRAAARSGTARSSFSGNPLRSDHRQPAARVRAHDAGVDAHGAVVYRLWLHDRQISRE